ncbi:hypothetical protein K466DRAFT_324657 [Polyporus arcularius HHB13444]|uniref:Uncharacterized protein n=1 Tax=Polyporus arcularius HHB13444 TaxID=1314778 RepID=A0A5C3Q7R6_9APHY|nr:hypothetical protein K466DRAFT_324657 [Polyporus arcularius HHB13444]
MKMPSNCVLPAFKARRSRPRFPMPSLRRASSLGDSGGVVLERASVGYEVASVQWYASSSLRSCRAWVPDKSKAAIRRTWAWMRPVVPPPAPMSVLSRTW